MVVHEKQTWCGVTGDVNILPSVFIEIRGDYSHPVTRASPRNSSMFTYIGESSVTVVSIERMLTGRQTSRSALDGYPLPTATTVLTRDQRVFQRKSYVVRNEQIEVPIAIVVHEAASGPPALLIAQKAGCLRHISECSIAVVAVENVLSKPGTKDVIKTIVVIVANANSAGPSNRVQSRLFCYVRKCAVPVVLIQSISCSFRCTFEARAR